MVLGNTQRLIPKATFPSGQCAYWGPAVPPDLKKPAAFSSSIATTGLLLGECRALHQALPIRPEGMVLSQMSLGTPDRQRAEGRGKFAHYVRKGGCDAPPESRMKQTTFWGSLGRERNLCKDPRAKQIWHVDWGRRGKMVEKDSDATDVLGTTRC